MAEVKASEFYDSDRKVIGYAPMIYDNLGRVHDFALYGDSPNMEFYKTPEEAMADYNRSEPVATGGCASCTLQRRRVMEND